MIGNIIRNSHSVKVFVMCLVPAQILSLQTISRKKKKKSPLKYDLKNGHKRIIRNKENKSLELKGSMVKCIIFFFQEFDKTLVLFIKVGWTRKRITCARQTLHLIESLCKTFLTSLGEIKVMKYPFFSVAIKNFLLKLYM